MSYKICRIENLEELIEEHRNISKKISVYEFDETSYTLLLIEINKVLKENKQLKEQLQQKEDIINKISKKCNKEKGKTDFDIFIQLNEQLKTLEGFAKKIDYNLHPIITEAYKCDIRNSINDLCNTIRYDVIYKDDVLEILEKSDK